MILLKKERAEKNKSSASKLPPPPPPIPNDLGKDNGEEKKEKKEEDSEFKDSKEYQLFLEHQKMHQKDPLTLSHLLNIIDGILETPGRILIITTNHPEKLDEALIRPGRIDMTVKFDRCTIQDTIDIVEMFYEEKFPTMEKNSLVNKKYTPAEVYQICFQSSGMSEAIRNLQKTSLNPLAYSAPISKGSPSGSVSSKGKSGKEKDDDTGAGVSLGKAK